MFKQKIDITWHSKRKSKDELEYNDDQGSMVGGMSSMMYMAFMLLLFVYQTDRVFRGKEDQYLFFKTTNNYEEIYNVS